MTGMLCKLRLFHAGDIQVKLHKRFVNEFSTACYIINRHHAEKLINTLILKGDEKYRLDNGVKPRPVADDLILHHNSGNTFSIPLLLYRELGSSIHPDHIDAHKGNYSAQLNYWQQNGMHIDIRDYMNYDPYHGRVAQPTGNQTT